MTSDESMSSQPRRETNSGGLDQDKPIADLTLGELLAVLRRAGIDSPGAAYSGSGSGAAYSAPDAGASRGDEQFSDSSESSQMEAARRIADSMNRETTSAREAVKRVVSLVGASPPEVQLAFLQGLTENKDEADRFQQDPVSYSREHGVLLDPEIVRTAVDVSVFDRGISPAMRDKLGPRALDALGGLRTPGGEVAWPAAVAAIAAVVAAGAAVVSAVTAVTKNNPADILAMKGLGPRGITMPGGGRYR